MFTNNPTSRVTSRGSHPLTWAGSWYPVRNDFPAYDTFDRYFDERLSIDQAQEAKALSAALKDANDYGKYSSGVIHTKLIKRDNVFLMQATLDQLGEIILVNRYHPSVYGISKGPCTRLVGRGGFWLDTVQSERSLCERVQNEIITLQVKLLLSKSCTIAETKLN